MSEFKVMIHRISEVIDHPKADRLSMNTVGGHVCISNKLEDGSHRYKVGDLVLYVPENAVVPEYLLRRGYWDEENSRGILGGPNGNMVKPIKLRGILSTGLIFQTLEREDGGIVFPTDSALIEVHEGMDLTGDLGVTEFQE